jgi:branched-chain amino acid aminotransferase
MDRIIGEYYIIDNIIFKTENLNNQFNNLEYQLYEVIRTADGVLIFLDDHLQRLEESLKSLGYIKFYLESVAKKNLFDLLVLNNNLEGNIKLICKFETNRLIYAEYYIPHYYPTDDYYNNGIKLKSYIINRNQPNIKQIQVNEFIKTSITNILSSDEFYEVLLINQNGFITEGSKSNFFLIKDNSLFTAPENWILKGVTRKYILKIAKKLKLTIIEKAIRLQELVEYESAFICGTSPKVLPVKEIDDLSFDTQNIILKYIIEQYNTIFLQQLELK